MREATCDNYFIVKYLLKSNVSRVTYELYQEVKTASTNLTWLYFYLHILIQIFCTLLIFFCARLSFAIDLLSNVLFQAFDYFWKHVFSKLLISSFHCVDIFCVKLRFCETFLVVNFVKRILLIEALYKFRAIKRWFTLYLHMYCLG